MPWVDHRSGGPFLSQKKRVKLPLSVSKFEHVGDDWSDKEARPHWRDLRSQSAEGGVEFKSSSFEESLHHLCRRKDLRAKA